MALRVARAHAYGNDFLLVPEADASTPSIADLARVLCDRHQGVGADGLILYTLRDRGATMKLVRPTTTPLSSNVVSQVPSDVCDPRMILATRKSLPLVSVAMVGPTVNRVPLARR